MSAAEEATAKPRVLIAGGGIAGMEALLALADLAGDRAELLMAAPEPDFRYRPMAVDEPFSFEPYQRRALAPAVAETGATFIQAGLAGVRPAERVAALEDGSEIAYAAMVVCVGARSRAAFPSAITFTVPGPQLDIDDLLRTAVDEPPHRLAFVLPSG